MDVVVLGIVGLFFSALLLPIAANLWMDAYNKFRAIKSRHRARQLDEQRTRQYYRQARAHDVCGPRGEHFPNPYA